LSELQEALEKAEAPSKKGGERPKHPSVPEWLHNIPESVFQNREVIGLIASVGAMLAGGVMMLDDVKDFGKDGTERNPPRIHHWLVGALTFMGGLIGTCTFGIAVLKKYVKPG
jgi:hypothetical protein